MNGSRPSHVITDESIPEPVKDNKAEFRAALYKRAAQLKQSRRKRNKLSLPR